MQDRFKFRYFYNGKLYDVLSIDFRRKNIDLKKDEMTLIHLESEFNDKNLIQCTGLKDKNGNLIYEGDIIEVQYFGAQIPLFHGKFEQNPENERFAITYNENWHKFVAENKYYCQTCEIHSLDLEKIQINPENKSYEIIGNVYENENLLKEVEE